MKPPAGVCTRDETTQGVREGDRQSGRGRGGQRHAHTHAHTHAQEMRKPQPQREKAGGGTHVRTRRGTACAHATDVEHRALSPPTRTPARTQAATDTRTQAQTTRILRKGQGRGGDLLRLLVLKRLLKHGLERPQLQALQLQLLLRLLLQQPELHRLLLFHGQVRRELPLLDVPAGRPLPPLQLPRHRPLLEGGLPSLQRLLELVELLPLLLFDGQLLALQILPRSRTNAQVGFWFGSFLKVFWKFLFC